MPASVTSLFWISLCAVIAPLVAGLVPRKLVPEVVLLLVLGVLVGPHVLELAATDEAIGMLHEFGLGMLFLLAGYEVEARDLAGRPGRRSLLAWVSCFGVALAFVTLLDLAGLIHSEVAVAIALTSTALGTLLPILKDNDLLSTDFGAAVLSHGAVGELGPIVAMAVLLGANGPIKSMVLLAAFALIAVLVSLFSTALRREGSHLVRLIRLGAETTGQTTVRLTVLLLVSLAAVTAAFDLDAVLGAFAAGMILRQLLPDGQEELETKLAGLAFGFVIPVFFVTSGMAIDPAAVVDEPVSLIAFLIAMLIVRGGIVFLFVRTERDALSVGRRFDERSSAAIALFAATGLPIIVAVSSVAVASGQMTSVNASVLVAGGAVSVLVFPLAATLLLHHARGRAIGSR